MLALVGCADTPEARSVAAPLIPAYPSEPKLLEFYVSASSPNSYFVDTGALTLAPGSEVQLTIVVRAAAGAETVTYESLRCETGEYRIHAVARPDRSWSRVAEPSWRRIEDGGPNRHRAALATEYLCDGPARVSTVEEILAAMRDPQFRHHGLGAGQ